MRTSAEQGAQVVGNCVLYVSEGLCQRLPRRRAWRVVQRLPAAPRRRRGQTPAIARGVVDRSYVALRQIDRVSHQACLESKALCRPLIKPFGPLRSGSASCFARALAGFQRPPTEWRPFETDQPVA